MGFLQSLKDNLPSGGKPYQLNGQVIDVDVATSDYGKTLFYLLDKPRAMQKANGTWKEITGTEDGTYKVYVPLIKFKEKDGETAEFTANGFPEHAESLSKLGINVDDFNDVESLIAAIGEVANKKTVTFTLWEKSFGPKLNPAQSYMVDTVEAPAAASKVTAKRGLPARR